MSSDADKVTPEQQSELNRIISTYKALRGEIAELANKISELEGDRQEHALVINAIRDCDPQRKCYRSIGGILVERTVADVLPAVTKNVQSIESVLTQLSERIRGKEKEADDWRVKHNITETTGQDAQQEQIKVTRRNGDGGEGVLV